MFKVYWDLYRQLYHKFTAEFELKKFEHRSLFGEVMERSIVAAFFDSMAGTNGAVFCTTLYKLYTVCVRNKTWLLVNFLLASESRCRNSKVHFLKDLINEEKILCVISSDHAATYCQVSHQWLFGMKVAYGQPTIMLSDLMKDRSYMDTKQEAQDTAGWRVKISYARW